MIGRKYDCGCSKGNVKSFGHTCGSSPLQSAPAACCTSHELRFVNDPCLRVSCDVIVSVPNFFLSFTNKPKLPVNANEVFFYHATAGRIRVLEYDGTSYRVEPVNSQKAGTVIEAGDCILPQIVTADQNTGGTEACLSGNFIAPASSGFQDVYLLNGASISIGSTVSISWEGEVGTYAVTGYVGSEDHIYTYTLQNTGSGLTPGTLVKGGVDGACDVPVKVLNDQDICDLPVAYTVDALTGCSNGSPRKFVPTAPNQTIVTDAQGKPTWQGVTYTNCCVTTAGTLKLSGTGCLVQDIVALNNINLACFEAAWNDAALHGNVLPAIIDSKPIIITNYNSGSHQITVVRAQSSLFDPVEEFPAGKSICLGECCNDCVEGEQITRVNYVGPGGDASRYSTFSFPDPGNLPYGAVAGNLNHYLVGKTPNSVLDVQGLISTYNDANGIRPSQIDNCLIRQKVCNTSIIGCTQEFEFDYNFELQFSGVPANVRVNWEIGHYAANSQTLEDGATLNPFTYASTKAAASGSFVGPMANDTTVTLGSNIGYGGPEGPKYYPNPKGFLRDFSFCKKCDCINSIVWLYVNLHTLVDGSSGNVRIAAVIRRRVRKTDVSEIIYAQNLPGLEPWKLTS